MTTILPDQKRLRETLPELAALPKEWLICIDGAKRIFFQNEKNDKTDYGHPTFGALPKPWILRYCVPSHGGPRVPRYYNTETNTAMDRNPRHDSKVLDQLNRALKGTVLGRAATFQKMKKGSTLDKFEREDIGQSDDIRNRYTYLKVLDPGAGERGAIGGMNGGVFVVKQRNTEVLSVEKRFTPKVTDGQVDFSGVQLGEKEIRMLHRLRHGSISFYTAAFVTPDFTKASLYVEFCDRGSLSDLITAYQKHRFSANDRDKPEIPERFIWHAFGGLCDGLAYLEGGRSYMSPEVRDYSRKAGWIPILHRDMKPDNVLLRSRDTLGSKRYWYCVISDFGLACEHYERGHPKEDKHQWRGGKLGTMDWLAPELCSTSYTVSRESWGFPQGMRHSAKSDLWALGACIYNLADCGPVYDRGYPQIGRTCAHLDMSNKPAGMGSHDFIQYQDSRKVQLDVREIVPRPNKPYTEQLQIAILRAAAWYPANRPEPIQMVRELKQLMKLSGFMTHTADESEQLPEWASRVHDYHSLDPLPFPTDPWDLKTQRWFGEGHQ